LQASLKTVSFRYKLAKTGLIITTSAAVISGALLLAR
jgi:hypothetical protein